MKKVELTRVEQDEECTIGVLNVCGRVVCYTLEKPWRDNQPNISCIPEGTYPLRLEYSPSKGRELWTIKDVPGRSYVRIHDGNTVDDTEGCPLTGMWPGKLKGKRAVLDSRTALSLFMGRMEGETEAEIIVRSAL